MPNDRRRRHNGPKPDPERWDWLKVTLRVDPVLRGQYVEIARRLDVNYDGVAQYAIRRYAARRGVDLPGWRPPEPGSRGAIKRTTSREPKLWIRVDPRWPDLLGGLTGGEVRTWHGVVREAIRELHEAGPEAWKNQ